MTVPTELGILAWRLTDGLRLPDDIEEQEREAAGRGRMLSSLAVAHATGQPSACCWLRSRPRGPVSVLLGGGVTPLSPPPVGENRAPIGFPAGSYGEHCGTPGALDTLNRLYYWTKLEIGFRAPDDEDDLPGPGLEDLFATLPERPMAVAALVTPVRPNDVSIELGALSDQVARLQPQAGGRGELRLELETTAARHRYLEKWSTLGLWSMKVWVAASTEADCRGVAALLSNTSDVRRLPIALRPPGAVPAARPTWADLNSSSVGSDAAAAIFRCPIREIPGVRLTPAPVFDVNPEKVGELEIGPVLDSTRTPSLPFSVPLESVNRHVFVTGATGSGKSQSVRTLLDQLSERKIPWLVIEPAKAEYARIAGRIATSGGTLTVIRPGALRVPPASLNPLEPSSIVVGNPPRREIFRLQTHMDLVRALFTASFQAEEPFPQILAQALTVAYEEQGWNVALGRSTEGDPAILPRFPYLEDLQRCAVAAVEAVEYGAQVEANVRGFVDVRLSSLRLGTSGQFFQDGHPLDLEALLRSNVVFEIEDLGDDRDKAFFIGTVLIRLFEVLRLYERHGRHTDDLRHVTVIEEAHRLLRNVGHESSTGDAVTMFADLLAEVRAYGEGIIVAEQIPAKIIPDVVKNSAVKVMHRLPSADDREFVGATMNLTPAQAQYVVSLEPGMAAAHVDGMDNPVLVAVDASRSELEVDSVPSTPAKVGMRSSSCPVRCTGSPCSFEDLRASAVLAEWPEVALWAETVVLAHLMGQRGGQLRSSFRSRLERLDTDRARCAIGLAATQSVRRRSRYIRQFYDSFTLERRVAEAMSEQLNLGANLDRPDPQWQIARFRWADVKRHLDREPVSVMLSQTPYPIPGQWSDRGLVLQGTTWEQVRDSLRELNRSLETPFPDTYLGNPPVLDELVTKMASGSTPKERIDAALAQIFSSPITWLAHLLYGEG